MRNFSMFAFALSLVALPQVVMAEPYVITDLGLLRFGDYTEATGINAAGHVVGFGDISNVDDIEEPFVYQNGGLLDLNATHHGPEEYVGDAFGINDRGQIVGNRSSYSEPHAVIYDHDRVTDLGTLAGLDSYGLAINASGEVAGYSDAGSGYHAFLYDGSLHDLGTFGGWESWAYGINDAGMVVGVSDLAGNQSSHAFVYANGSLQDLGTLGGMSSGAKGINNSGQIVGISDLADGDERPFLYEDGTMIDLGSLGGTSAVANAINDAGQIVGDSSILGNYYGSAFIYDHGVMSDLNKLIDPKLGWILMSATAINASGQIVGYGLIGGNTHGFLLTPVGLVPEPAAWALMIAGFGFVGAALRRRVAAPRRGCTIARA